MLAGAVGRRKGSYTLGRYGSNINDPAAALLLHYLHRLASAQKRPSKIDCHHPIPGLKRQLIQGASIKHASVVDQYVQPRKALHGLAKQPIDVLLIRNIRFERHHFRTAFAQKTGELIEQFAAASGDYKRCTLAGKRVGQAAADPTACSGYKCGLPLQFLHLYPRGHELVVLRRRILTILFCAIWPQKSRSPKNNRTNASRLRLRKSKADAERRGNDRRYPPK